MMHLRYCCVPAVATVISAQHTRMTSKLLSRGNDGDTERERKREEQRYRETDRQGGGVVELESPSTHIDAEETGHSMQIVGITRHVHNLWDDSLLGPLHSKLLYQLLQVQRGRLTNGVH